MGETPTDERRVDFLTGLLFLALGLLAAGIAWGYPLGSAGRMGPGYFPLAVSLLLAAVGAALCLRNRAALPRPRRDEASAVSTAGASLWRALAVVVASIGSFALLIERLGLAITAVICVAIAFYGARPLMAKPGASWEGIVVALGLAIFSVAVFVYGIGIPMRVWPR